MVERPAIAVVEMHLAQLSDQALVDQALGGDMAFDPAERPVDRHLLAGALHRRDHPPRVCGGGGEGLFHENVETVRRQALRIRGVVTGGGAEDRHVVGAGFHTGIEIRKEFILRHAERACHGLHFCKVRIVEPGDLRLRVLMHEAQQVTHVHVVETDADDAEFRHVFLPQRCSVKRT